uniref:Uncharacterized protein n=1 Tax=Cannabis sativa TaxID=3483 RepID=A0A803QDH1_CANSA
SPFLCGLGVSGPRSKFSRPSLKACLSLQSGTRWSVSKFRPLVFVWDMWGPESSMLFQSRIRSLDSASGSKSSVLDSVLGSSLGSWVRVKVQVQVPNVSKFGLLGSRSQPKSRGPLIFRLVRGLRSRGGPVWVLLHPVPARVPNFLVQSQARSQFGFSSLAPESWDLNTNWSVLCPASRSGARVLGSSSWSGTAPALALVLQAWGPRSSWILGSVSLYLCGFGVPCSLVSQCLVLVLPGSLPRSLSLGFDLELGLSSHGVRGLRSPVWGFKVLISARVRDRAPRGSSRAPGLCLGRVLVLKFQSQSQTDTSRSKSCWLLILVSVSTLGPGISGPRSMFQLISIPASGSRVSILLGSDPDSFNLGPSLRFGTRIPDLCPCVRLSVLFVR